MSRLYTDREDQNLILSSFSGVDAHRCFRFPVPWMSMYHLFYSHILHCHHTLFYVSPLYSVKATMFTYNWVLFMYFVLFIVRELIIPPADEAVTGDLSILEILIRHMLNCKNDIPLDGELKHMYISHSLWIQI